MVPADLGAGGHDVVQTPLVLLDMELEHPLLVRDLIQLPDIDGPEMLDVDGPPLSQTQATGSEHVTAQGCPLLFELLNL